MNNPWSTHDLKYQNRGIVDGVPVGRIYNNIIIGFVYDFNLKHFTRNVAFRYSMGYIKNINLINRLKHA